MVVKSIIYFIVTFIVSTLVSMILFLNLGYIGDIGFIENLKTIFDHVTEFIFGITLVITNSILYFLNSLCNDPT